MQNVSNEELHIRFIYNVNFVRINNVYKKSLKIPKG
jgi:hypothetical protein